MSLLWNPWHGCQKLSEGCLNCYVFRIDGKIDRNSGDVVRNRAFDLPISRNKTGYKIKSGETVYTCLSSDFFLDIADKWRREAWSIIAKRPDLHFVIITKRIQRFSVELPDDWGNGYDNVTICCTCENQRRADERLPYFIAAPIKHREIVCEPLLESIDLSRYLGPEIELVTVGGESGDGARICDYNWVLSIRDACITEGVRFHFKQTGANFKRGDRIYHIPRSEQLRQAQKASIDVN